MNNKVQFLSFDKMAGRHGLILEKLMLEKRLIYGYHPNLISDTRRLKFLNHNDRVILKEHLQKAIEDLMFSLYPYPIHISDKRKRRAMMKLLQFLALNLGKEARYRQIADFADSDHKTIARYLDRLEQLDVIIKLESFSRDHPLEKSQGKKFYFLDCGIRNALIANFNTSEKRNDWDVLWENFVIAERIKYKRSHKFQANHFYWQNYNNLHLPYIEEKQNQLHAYQISWETTPKSAFSWPALFTKNYPKAHLRVLQPGNIEKFIGRTTLKDEVFPLPES